MDADILNRLLIVLSDQKVSNIPKTPKEKPLSLEEASTSPSPIPTPTKRMSNKDTQTILEKIPTTEWEFEDILEKIRDVIEENNRLNQELLQMKQSTTSAPLEEPDLTDPLMVKHKFLTEENDFLIGRLRSSEQRFATFLTSLTRKFVEIKMADLEKRTTSNEDQYKSPSEESLKHILARIRGESVTGILNELKTETLLERIDTERKLDKVAVISENLEPSQFITQEEYHNLMNQLNKLRTDNQEIAKKNSDLLVLLKLQQDQMTAEQQIVNRITDEEIALRHLVVDLQSSGNEKQLIARAYRDLAVGKSEISIILPSILLRSQ